MKKRHAVRTANKINVLKTGIKVTWLKKKTKELICSRLERM